MGVKINLENVRVQMEKVTSGAQIVSAVKVGTLDESRGLVLGSKWRRRDEEVL